MGLQHLAQQQSENESAMPPLILRWTQAGLVTVCETTSPWRHHPLGTSFMGFSSLVSFQSAFGSEIATWLGISSRGLATKSRTESSICVFNCIVFEAKWGNLTLSHYLLFRMSLCPLYHTYIHTIYIHIYIYKKHITHTRTHTTHTYLLAT